MLVDLRKNPQKLAKAVQILQSMLDEFKLENIIEGNKKKDCKDCQNRDQQNLIKVERKKMRCEVRIKGTNLLEATRADRNDKQHIPAIGSNEAGETFQCQLERNKQPKTPHSDRGREIKHAFSISDIPLTSRVDDLILAFVKNKVTPISPVKPGQPANHAAVMLTNVVDTLAGISIDKRKLPKVEATSMVLYMNMIFGWKGMETLKAHLISVRFWGSCWSQEDCTEVFRESALVKALPLMFRQTVAQFAYLDRKQSAETVNRRVLDNTPGDAHLERETQGSADTQVLESVPEIAPHDEKVQGPQIPCALGDVSDHPCLRQKVQEPATSCVREMVNLARFHSHWAIARKATNAEELQALITKLKAEFEHLNFMPDHFTLKEVLVCAYLGNKAHDLKLVKITVKKWEECLEAGHQYHALESVFESAGVFLLIPKEFTYNTFKSMGLKAFSCLLTVWLNQFPELIKVCENLQKHVLRPILDGDEPAVLALEKWKHIKGSSLSLVEGTRVIEKDEVVDQGKVDEDLIEL
ncbi:MAG: hypothetical protein M1824_005094 [Vezdaea acicularis]|nr:MAG: hypothetical protein M1824_005094 [Vezdaea acicularis]